MNKTILALFFLCAAARAATPLDTWTVRSDATTPILRDVKFGNGIFVAVGDNGTAASTNGINWRSTPLASGTISTAAFGGGKWIATASALLWESRNGSNWISRSLSGVSEFNGVAHGNDRFVVIGRSSRVSVSVDGDFWITSDVQLGELYDASFAGGRFFVNGPTKTFSSVDGFSWSEVSALLLGDIAVLGGRLFSSRYQRTSVDGMSWDSAAIPPSTFSLSTIVGLPSPLLGSSGDQIWASIDGTNWVTWPTQQATPIYTGIAYGHGIAVAAGYSTANSRGLIVTSETITETGPPSVSAGIFAGVTVVGAVGRTYRIEAAETADATEWQSVGQITLTRSPLTWFDENSPAISRRFYRAVLLP